MKKISLIAFLVFSTSCFADGPIGLGKIEIDMLKSDLESLTEKDETYLASPLTRVQLRASTPVENEERFDSSIMTSISKEPIQAIFIFQNERLQEMVLTFNKEKEKSNLKLVEDLIKDKYGSPTIVDNMEENQCIYKGGANFKIKSGTLEKYWIQNRPDAKPIKSTIRHTIMDKCPSDLRYGIGALSLSNLNIKAVKQDQPKKNPF